MTDFLSLEILRTFTHFFLHLIFPAFIALLFFRDNWRKAWFIMLATMLVDLDHLLAYPAVYDAMRCSINFHPLHTYWAMVVYVVLLYPVKTRVAAVGLLFHMFTDALDCLWLFFMVR